MGSCGSNTILALSMKELAKHRRGHGHHCLQRYIGLKDVFGSELLTDSLISSLLMELHAGLGTHTMRTYYLTGKGFLLLLCLIDLVFVEKMLRVLVPSFFAEQCTTPPP
jgi:hypothetical protein